MKRIEVSPGDFYGDMEVIREIPAKAAGKRLLLCRCSCGNETEVRLAHLRSGQTGTCGHCGMEHKGERKTVKAWAKESGIKPSTLSARLKRMGLGEALEMGAGR